MKKSLLLLPLILSLPICVFSQASSYSDRLSVTKEIRTAEEGFAYEEFRRGVQAFYRGTFNEAILQFEKALTYTPTDSRILDWMGKAYYYSGLEGIALQEWEKAKNNGYGGILLENKIRIVAERRFTLEENGMEDVYTESGSYPGIYNGNLIYTEPVSILPNGNGTFWVLAYGSNQLLLFNVNGTVIDRITGPLNGFDHPLDMIRLSSGKILLTETLGNRLSVLSKNGRFEKYIGSKGRGNGSFIGPQYVAEDFRGNIYATDYGNRRVVVFDKEGNALFVFGTSSKTFSGLKGPTGIAVLGDSVYVADDVKGCIYEFDLAGNFIRNLVLEGTFRRPESLKVWTDRLVVCDSNKVISVNTHTGEIFENMNMGNAPSRITCAIPDVNGNVLVSDFKANEVYVMARMQELVGGLFVQIERVNAKNFPDVQLDVKVESLKRNPIVGLKEANFYITEDRRPVNKLKFLGAASENTYCDVTVIIDRSLSSDSPLSDSMIETAVKSVAEGMNGKGTLRILSAGLLPVVEFTGNPKDVRNFNASALKTKKSSVVPLDLAFRLAVNDLINAGKKRAVVFVTHGNVTERSFERYSLSQTVAYMNNNSVMCSSIFLSRENVSEETEYIMKNTKGKSYYVFREEGLASLVEDLLDIPQGNYSFSYVSTLPTNFGENFLPVEIESYLMNRSGRDESGYFSPLK